MLTTHLNKGGKNKMAWPQTLYLLSKLKSLISNLTIGTASVDDVLDGKTFASGSENNMLVGAMPNHSGETVTATSISRSGNYIETSIPQKGYYDTDSKIQIECNGQYRLIGTWSNGSGGSTTTGTIDIKQYYSDYASLTASNFASYLTSVSASGDIGEHGHGSTGSASLSYNASNGILTWSKYNDYYSWAGAGISSTSGVIFLIYP
jgi:hypothetical protein